jgi:hypothetical protein
MKIKRVILSCILLALFNDKNARADDSTETTSSGAGDGASTTDATETTTTTTTTSTPNWNYVKNGEDWGSLGYTSCTTGAQAPIDLPSGIEQKPSDTDEFQKHYRDVVESNDIVGVFGYPALEVNLPFFTNKKFYRNYFVSNYG